MGDMCCQCRKWLSTDADGNVLDHVCPVSTAAYIGDGIYASFDGYQVEVHTSNGIGVSTPIYFDSTAAQSLIDYFKKVWNHG